MIMTVEDLQFPIMAIRNLMLRTKMEVILILQPKEVKPMIVTPISRRRNPSKKRPLMTRIEVWTRMI